MTWLMPSPRGCRLIGNKFCMFSDQATTHHGREGGRILWMRLGFDRLHEISGSPQLLRSALENMTLADKMKHSSRLKISV